MSDQTPRWTCIIVNVLDCISGTDDMSYGYDGAGKIIENDETRGYGEIFGVDDVVGVYVDFGEERKKISEMVEITFTVNGKSVPAAFQVEKTKLNGRALYPHIISKNCRFQVNFGRLEEPWFQAKPGFQWAASVVPSAAPGAAAVSDAASDAAASFAINAPAAVRGPIAPATKQVTDCTRNWVACMPVQRQQLMAL